MSSDIPKARAILLDMANRLDAVVPAEAVMLRHIVEEMLVRERPVRKAPVTRRRVTPALKAAIRADAAMNPKDCFHDIAERHGVNIGRVSEVLR